MLDCKIVISEFELQLRHNVNLWTNTIWEWMNLIVSPTAGRIEPQPFFYKDIFELSPKVGWLL